MSSTIADQASTTSVYNPLSQNESETIRRFITDRVQTINNSDELNQMLEVIEEQPKRNSTTSRQSVRRSSTIKPAPIVDFKLMTYIQMLLTISLVPFCVMSIVASPYRSKYVPLNYQPSLSTLSLIVLLWYCVQLGLHKYFPARLISGKAGSMKKVAYRCDSTRSMLFTIIFILSPLLRQKIPVIRSVDRLFLIDSLIIFVLLIWSIKKSKSNELVNSLIFGSSVPFRYKGVDLKHFIWQHITPISCVCINCLLFNQLYSLNLLSIPSVLCLIFATFPKLESILYETNYLQNESSNRTIGLFELFAWHSLSLFCPFIAIASINSQQKSTPRIRSLLSLSLFAVGYFVHQRSQTTARKKHFNNMFICTSDGSKTTKNKILNLCKYPSVLGQVLVDCSIAIISSSESVLPWFCFSFRFLARLFKVEEMESKRIKNKNNLNQYLLLPPLY